MSAHENYLKRSICAWNSFAVLFASCERGTFIDY